MSNLYTDDYRFRHSLHPGDRIETDSGTYVITDDLLSFGGSSVVYSAECSDGIKYVIKEVFPNDHQERFARINGVIQPADPLDAKSAMLLEKLRLKLETEQTLGLKCFKGTVLAVPIRKILNATAVTHDGIRHTDVSRGLFAVLDSMDRKTSKRFSEILADIAREKDADHPLRTGGLPTLHTTLSLMEQVLLSLDSIHSQDVLFSDINLDNIVFNEWKPEQGSFGIPFMLDFGCARELHGPEDDKKTTPIENKEVFSTYGFTPPELIYENDGTLQLTKTADIYAAGALMLRTLLTEAHLNYLGRSPLIDDDVLQMDDGERLGIPDSVRLKLNAILFKAMNRNREARYPTANAMRRAITQLKRDVAPPSYLLPPAPNSAESFVEGSRVTEIRDTLAALKINTPVFLWGCPGIGKSEVAIKVAQEFGCRSPKGSYFIHYTCPSDKNAEAMEETVLRMPFEGFKYEPDKPGMSPEEQRKDEYRKRIGLLKREYGGALLVIDNFDRRGKTLKDLKAEPSYQEITSIGLNLLFTTRYEVPGAKEVKELSRDDLLLLMRRWCTDPRIGDQQLLDLIDAVDGHTLTVDIMARTLGCSRRKITPEMILDAFRSSNLSEMEYPKVTVETVKKGQEFDRIQHREPKTARIYEHLKALFDLSGLDNQMKTILCCATLLPDSGMDCQLFESCLADGYGDAFEYLLDCGWLKNSVDNVLRIHPVIREVCRTELAPTDSVCSPFITQLAKSFDDNHYDHGQYQSMADCFANGADFLPDEDGQFAQHAQEIYMILSQCNKSVTYGRKALEKLSRNEQGNAEQIAVCNLHVSSACFMLGDMLTALRHAENGRDIVNDHDVDNRLLLAGLFNITGLIMGAMGEYREQVDWCRMALGAHLDSGDNDCRKISAYLVNIALAQEELGDLGNAFKPAYDAVRLQENSPDPDHPEMAKALHALGHIIYKISEADERQKLYEYALDRYNQAEAIRKKYLPADHPSFSPLYRDMAKVYRKLENWPQTIAYYQLAADLNDAYSMNELAQLLLHGVGCAQDIPRGVVLLEKAASLGNLDAAYNLGFSHLYGDFVSLDYQKAEHYLLTAANHPQKPHADACGQLYVLYDGLIPNSAGVIPVNHEKALKYLVKADALGLKNIMILDEPTNEEPSIS